LTPARWSTLPAAGLAVVAELATRFGDAPINAFTLMKVIGRDIWIGIWCLILSVVSVISWDKVAGEKAGRVSAGIIWERFPKFVIGFLAASVIMSFVSARPPAGRTATSPWEGSYQGLSYQADFAGFTIPVALADRFTVDAQGKTLAFKGPLSREDCKLLAEFATPDQARALDALRARTNWFESVLTPQVVGPVKKLRSWAFVLCFLCIGLSTRFRDLATFGLKPFWAFTLGVLVNVPLGFLLSAVVFEKYWANL
jgi:hypothetical protein